MKAFSLIGRIINLEYHLQGQYSTEAEGAQNLQT